MTWERKGTEVPCSAAGMLGSSFGLWPCSREERLRFGAKLSTGHIGHLSVPGLTFSGVNWTCSWIWLAGKFGNAEKLCCARLE